MMLKFIHNKGKFGINNISGFAGLCFGDAAGHREVSRGRQPLLSRLLQQLGVSGVQSHVSPVSGTIFSFLFRCAFTNKKKMLTGCWSLYTSTLLYHKYTPPPASLPGPHPPL